MKILFFGDIVGKIGRKAMIKILPELKSQLKPDLVLANAENLAHGKGVTIKTIREAMDAGIDFFTSGNHFWSKKGELKEVIARKSPIIRPANYRGRRLGEGWAKINLAGQKVLIINLTGKAFIDREGNKITNPLRKADKILAKRGKGVKIIIIDFHAEATAEKMILFQYIKGRVSAVIGTHTHIQTADEQISQGTAYITDSGMVGAKDSIIGDKKETIIGRYLANDFGPIGNIEIPKKGAVVVNGVLIEIDKKSGRAVKIKRIAREVEIV